MCEVRSKSIMGTSAEPSLSRKKKYPGQPARDHLLYDKDEGESSDSWRWARTLVSCPKNPTPGPGQDERWHAVGRIEAGQSITDVALFFDIHHSPSNPEGYDYIDVDSMSIGLCLIGVTLCSRMSQNLPCKQKTGSKGLERSSHSQSSPEHHPRWERHIAAVIVNNYLESEGIACMEWPVYSHDLNLIQNLRDALSCAVCKCFPPPSHYHRVAKCSMRGRVNACICNG
ncbi:hypothetical protein CDAR_232901 [Caerostris darwini]|uniref:Tc1-like transposase DDE domain-containing protein n=1 Tax=Caerostris darwini TaxID=1538125 RepID=A0AAV4T6M0_9ARAC|nr:hypothetical protein CDAR_232901 [Caerostris darwini]